MKNKKDRFTEIREIISTNVIVSQEELLKQLYARGMSLTQATLSRDLKQMKITKEPDESGVYRYRLPKDLQREESLVNFPRRIRCRVQISGNIVVLHTEPGYASQLAYQIDEYMRGVIIGTVAGEDTLIGVMGEGVARIEVVNGLSRIIPSMEGPD